MGSVRNSLLNMAAPLDNENTGYIWSNGGSTIRQFSAITLKLTKKSSANHAGRPMTWTDSKHCSSTRCAALNVLTELVSSRIFRQSMETCCGKLMNNYCCPVPNSEYFKRWRPKSEQ